MQVLKEPIPIGDLTRRWQIYLLLALGTVGLALAGGGLLSPGGRQFLRHIKYDIILGQPLIYGVPRQPVACNTLRGPGTMVVLAFGQSNSANFGRPRYQPDGAVFSFYQGHCYRAEDPMPGAGGSGGSVWTRLGERIIGQSLARTVIFATIGFGGSQIARWSTGGDLHTRLLDTTAALKTAGLAPTHLFWHQGEADGARGTNAATYQNAFLDMLDSLRRHGVNAPIYVAVATYCHGQGSTELQQAQRGLVNPAAQIYPGPDTDALTTVRLRYDDCHFSEVGLSEHAEAWLRSLRANPE
jgi:hypothetical protein